MPSDLDTLKEQVFEANLELVHEGLVVFTFGNASGIDRNTGLVVIKPSGVDYSALKPSDMVVTDLEGKIVEGHLHGIAAARAFDARGERLLDEHARDRVESL